MFSVYLYIVYIYLISYPILLILPRTPQNQEILTIHNLQTFHCINLEFFQPSNIFESRYSENIIEFS